MRNLSNQLLGKKGEDIASTYLQNKGYHIIERNFKKGYGELDIIACKGSTLVFVEVKTRVGREFGLPEESVTPRKLREVTHTAKYYKLIHPELPDELRIDVVAIELDHTDRVVYFNHIISVTS